MRAIPAAILGALVGSGVTGAVGAWLTGRDPARPDRWWAAPPPRVVIPPADLIPPQHLPTTPKGD
mgnify:CR=1 FL=1